jgi:hypothetical protein
MYKIINENTIQRLEDGACIPKDEGNRDYRSYLEWLEQGNTPLPAYTEEELAERNKSIREENVRRLLYESDYIELPSFLERKGQDSYNLWMSYRADLRSAYHDIALPIPQKPE